VTALEHGKSSSTAWGVALARVAHVRFHAPPPIFDDSLAFELVEPEIQPILEHYAPSDAFPAELYAARAYLAFRQRYQEERLAAAFDRGVTQYVILGAGLDSYAFRQPDEQRGLTIFEVDFPATQEEKRARIETLGWPWPDNLVFAPCDFENDILAESLLRSGFDRTRPACFAWMGVTVYLERDTVFDTLSQMRGLSAAGSSIAFEYALPSEGLRGTDKLAREFSLAADNRKREPFVSFYEPGEIPDLVRRAGWERVELLDHEAASAQVLAGRQDGLSIHYGLRLAEAFC
jgi:methyltransferase (TIGR00027 family)